MIGRRFRATVLMASLSLTASVVGCGKDCMEPEGDIPPDEIETALGFDTPGLVPELFAPDLIEGDTGEFSVAISPRQDELFFTRATFGEGEVRFELQVSELDDGKWTVPRAVPFASGLGEAEAFFDAGGDRLYFYSGHPEPGYPDSRRVMSLWYVDREGGGWGERRYLGFPDAPIRYNWSGSLMGPTTYLFTARPYEDGNLADIYQAPITDDGFGPAVNIGPPVNTTDYTENEPAVAPDGSYLVFYSAGRPENLNPRGMGDLFISFRQPDQSWGEPQHLDEPINSAGEENWPRFSPDGKYLFFSSTRRNAVGFIDIYWVSTDALDKYRPAIPAN